MGTNANGYQGQLRAVDQQYGCFKANVELMNLISADAGVPVSYVEKIAIYSTPPTKVRLNNHVFEIGKTHIWEVNNTEITSIQFVEDTDKFTVIDYIIK